MEGSPVLQTEMTPWQQRISRLRWWWTHYRRRHLPYLVWYNDELDVVVTFKDDKLYAGSFDNEQEAMGAAVGQFARGVLPYVKQQLNEIGIEFDSGLGLNGRDWEWDWSLRGPISVRFRGRAAKPERRT